MSGAGFIKDDGSDEECIYEIKDAVKQYTLKARELNDLHIRAVKQGKQGMFLVYFQEGNFTAEIRLIPNQGSGL